MLARFAAKTLYRLLELAEKAEHFPGGTYTRVCRIAGNKLTVEYRAAAMVGLERLANSSPALPPLPSGVYQEQEKPPAQQSGD